VRFISGARQRKNARQASSLPCARKNARQRSCLPCVLFLSARQRFFSHRPLAAINKQVEAKCLRRAFLAWRTTIFFPFISPTKPQIQ
jgi:hypothetical protein